MRPGQPRFFETVGLLLALRFKLFARRLTRRGLAGTILAVTAAVAVSCLLGVGSYLLFGTVEGIAREPVWLAFTSGLFFFLLGLFWIIWPVIAAQVDEAYELGRFFGYPVRPARLYLIQSATGLLEPSVLFFYPALVGAGLGLARSLRPGGLVTLGLMLAFAVMHLATGRFLQNLFLNIMTSRRSGEFLFGGVLLLLGLSVFIPPVDASWLFSRFGGLDATPEDLALLSRTARALGNTPPGWLAVGLAASAAGAMHVVVGSACFMIVVSGVTWLLGLVLLKRFYRGGRGFRLLPTRAIVGSPRPARRGWRLPGLPDCVSTVFEKEFKTLFSNPKARLLFAVPFFLVIIVKIIGAPQLFLFLWGNAWASVLLALLGVYVLSVLSGQFFGNGFGYDGPGVRQTFLAPAPPSSWLLGRNLAQGLFATLQFTGLALLVFALMPGARADKLAIPLLTYPFGLLVMLGVGNLLSARYPRRFHLTLSRRDRPVGATFVWILSVLGGCMVLALALMGLAGGSKAGLWLCLAVLPLVGLGVYRALFPLALRWTAEERERIIEAVSRAA